MNRRDCIRREKTTKSTRHKSKAKHRRIRRLARRGVARQNTKSVKKCYEYVHHDVHERIETHQQSKKTKAKSRHQINLEGMAFRLRKARKSGGLVLVTYSHRKAHIVTMMARPRILALTRDLPRARTQAHFLSTARAVCSTVAYRTAALRALHSASFHLRMKASASSSTHRRK